MNYINPIYSTNNLFLPIFKQKEVSDNVVSKPINPEISMNGVDALANYNLGSVNKSKDFEVSLVEPILVPDDIDQVNGERIYNSSGELVEIVNEGKDFKYVYKPGSLSNKIYHISVIDKKTNKVIKEQSKSKYTMYENPLIDVVEFNNGICIGTTYDSKTLTPTHFDKIIDTCEKEKHISYDFQYKNFLTYEFDKINNIEKRTYYDKNGNLIEKPRVKNKSKEYVNMEKPTLHPRIELNNDPKQLNGEKKYYSNGEIEQIIVNRNDKKTIYKFDTKGNVEEIQENNLTIYYFNDENHSPGYSIKEDFGNGKSKTSVYLNDGTTSCSVEDNGNGKQYNFNKKGDIISYLDYTYEEI